MSDVGELVRGETEQLADVLDGLRTEQWETASLCAGWGVREVVAHLLMPYELSIPGFLVRMIAARFRFDTVADRVATGDRRPPQALVAALRGTPEQKFNVPGAPAEAPLSHVLIHSEDIYRPLAVRPPRSVEAADTTLEQLTRPGFTTPGLLDGLRLTSTDTDWSHGNGAEVTGPAAALITTLAGRTAALDELTGPGTSDLQARLQNR